MALIELLLEQVVPTGLPSKPLEAGVENRLRAGGLTV